VWMRPNCMSVLRQTASTDGSGIPCAMESSMRDMAGRFIRKL
jgi:hypothetical protein